MYNFCFNWISSIPICTHHPRNSTILLALLTRTYHMINHVHWLITLSAHSKPIKQMLMYMLISIYFSSLPFAVWIIFMNLFWSHYIIIHVNLMVRKKCLSGPMWFLPTTINHILKHLLSINLPISPFTTLCHVYNYLRDVHPKSQGLFLAISIVPALPVRMLAHGCHSE